MPIKIQEIYRYKEILERENIFVMDEGRAGTPGHSPTSDSDPESDASEKKKQNCSFCGLCQTHHYRWT